MIVLNCKQLDRNVSDQCNLSQTTRCWAYRIWAVTCDFQPCGILTWIHSDESSQPPVKLRNSKWCSVSSLTLIEYSSDWQRLWSDCAYAQADLRLCCSHLPHCCKSDVVAHVLLFILNTCMCSSVVRLDAYSMPSSTPVLSVYEHWRLWRDCTNAQTRYNNHCSLMRQVPKSLEMAELSDRIKWYLNFYLETIEINQLTLWSSMFVDILFR